jgi:acyl-coenzyme A synthetase/AMP-(fatty) acid ligase
MTYFRTGDVVRQDTPGGNFWFCGRADNQVKIRGVRIEMEAVEEALLSLRGVTDAAVVAVALSRDRHVQSLAAFVVVKSADERGEGDRNGAGRGDRNEGEKGEEGKEVEAVRSRLMAEVSVLLPAAVVPSVIRVLEALPLTPNGEKETRDER